MVRKVRWSRRITGGLRSLDTSCCAYCLTRQASLQSLRSRGSLTLHFCRRLDGLEWHSIFRLSSQIHLACFFVTANSTYVSDLNFEIFFFLDKFNVIFNYFNLIFTSVPISIIVDSQTHSVILQYSKANKYSCEMGIQIHRVQCWPI